MNDWQFLIIPVIALAIYILASLLGGRNNQNQAPRRPGEAAPARPRRNPTALDRFLEEVRSRREGAAPRPEPEPPRPRPKPRPAPAPRSRPTIKSRVEESLPYVLPVEERPKPAPTPGLRRTMPAAPASVVPAEPGLPPVAQPEVARVVPLAGPVPQLLALLRSPTGLPTAVMLREILDAPLCRRRRRTP